MAGNTLFFPADSIPEAAARMFALTGSTNSGTRGPKRALVALAESLGIDVDLAATNAVLGGEIAWALGQGWQSDVDFEDLQITLTGLNGLLEAATDRLWGQAGQKTVDSSTAREVLRGMPGFHPAESKLGAVNRISAITGSGPEALGPGGKEQKSVFVNLARGLAPDLDPNLTKHQLAAALCSRFGVPWLASGASTGQSVTLDGLNLVLAGAERVRRVAAPAWTSATEEARDLIRVLANELEVPWDGRSTVEGMRENQSPSWRQMEWQGFHFEEQVQWLLGSAFPTPSLGGPQRRFHGTTFDYTSPLRVWDAKAHTGWTHEQPGDVLTRASSSAILNKVEAVEACVSQQGLGFLVVEGVARYDATGAFDDWHRAFTREGQRNSLSQSNSGVRRRRKSAFVPQSLRAIWIPDEHSLRAGIAGGWLSQRTQGRQAVRPGQTEGATRSDKFHIDLVAASPWVVARHEWPVTHLVR